MDLSRYQPMRRSGALAPLGRVIAALDLVAAWVIIAMLVVMVSVVAAQVLLRYGLNSSIGWADEISRLTFVWTIFLAIPLGVRAGVHIGMDIVLEKLPTAARAGLIRLMALVAAAMVALVAWQSVLLAADQWDELMSSVNWSASWFIVPLAIGGMHSALHLLWIAVTGPTAADPEFAKDID